MGGVTTGQSGESAEEGFGRQRDQVAEGKEDGMAERRAEGYGKGNDIGA